MADLTTLKLQRSTARKSFTKVANKLENGLKTPGHDVSELTSYMKLLDQRFYAIENLNVKISDALLQETCAESELEAEQDRIDDYCMTFFRLKALYDDLMQQQADDRKSVSSVDSVNRETAKRLCKLPVIQLKSFKGDIGEWLPFWGQFEKIHLDKDIDDADKLSFLTQAMVKGSPAHELVESYPASKQMYPFVVKALEERFGRKDLLTEHYIRGLLGVVIQNATAKEKLPLSSLYDKIQSNLRNLQILEITTDKCAPILLPLVSSCLPRDVLQSWERHVSKDRGSKGSDAVLESLLEFLKAEVEGNQKLVMAMSGFGLSDVSPSNSGDKKKKTNQAESENIPTAAGLLTTSSDAKNCIFCAEAHEPQNCQVAPSMTVKARRKVVVDKRACFCCLVTGHSAKFCRNRPKCDICQKPHFALVCEISEGGTVQRPIDASDSPKSSDTLASMSVSCNVLLETLRIKLHCGEKSKVVRALIDSGSQRTYVLKDTANDLGYKALRTERINHCLFGGVSTGVVNHDVFRLLATSVDGSYSCNFEAVEQLRICNNVQPVPQGPWMNELKENNIDLTDFHDGPIELLIGADIAGKLLTGGHKVLKCGLSAIETKLGWALIGKVPGTSEENMAMTVISMLTKDAKITDLWTLDTLGIGDPTEKQSATEVEAATMEHFLQTVNTAKDGRFEVHLPWVENHPPLASNYQLALKRTQNTVKRLKRDGYYQAYHQLLGEWLQDGVIEEVTEGDTKETSHYLPHRHVIKPGSTTPVRPVFDASARENRYPSLNQCLEKGPNMIEKIPSVIARFRMKKIGVVGDIRRAFLQISITAQDRDYLRFFWITEDGRLKIYRHCRVVFGLSSSPFQLGACIDFHLQRVLKDCKEGVRDIPLKLVELLQASFYVDNCLTSVEDEETAADFIDIATSVMLERKFDLRGWECNSPEPGPPTNVLGMLWDRHDDTLAVDVKGVLSMDFEKITKRVILSAAHKVFDPIGLTSCVTLVPKLMLQKTWESGLGWDDEVDQNLSREFLSWLSEVHHLTDAKIPRWLPGTNEIHERWSLHVFSDACQRSYGAVIFLRVENEGEEVRVQFVRAKARVSPSCKTSKGLTIPRLELLAASIAARLYRSVVEEYGLDGINTYFHTDSTTVLAWIVRQEPWELFVYNRVKEIRNLTEGCKWSHIQGTLNPADLPSRGCPPKKFAKSRWWEGPDWLKKEEKDWPQPVVDYNEEEINQERKKCVISSLFCSKVDDWYYRRFSHYKMIVRMVGWIYRIKNNAQLQKHMRPTGDLSAREFMLAEYKVLSMVQNEVFCGVLDPKLKGLLPFVDSHGLIRIMTKISYRTDLHEFRHPIVLPTEHPVVQRLILDAHFGNCHAGVQMLLSILRQQFWILGGRRAIRTVLNSCVKCKRFSSKHMESTPTPLPEARVRDAKVFEIVGVDLAGPLYLKAENCPRIKAYVCLFTCAVYRAVHLELISSQSTDSFIQGLRRFMSRRGRPSIIFSDNGTNFVGFNNASLELNWNEIGRYSAAQKIEWRFNPPSAPWWGGWWERLVGVLKQLLRRVLGQAALNYEEMQTVLCDCEAVMNARPLTYSSDNPNDLSAITPSMFLQGVDEVGTPDLDQIESTDLRKRVQYRQKLCQMLRGRFRDEYLGQMKLSATKDKIREILPGEIVLIGDDRSARLGWPLGRVVNVIEGTDGHSRVVKLKTAAGELTRPVQRLYPLEVNMKLVPEDQVTAQLRRVIESPVPVGKSSVHHPSVAMTDEEAEEDVTAGGEKSDATPNVTTRYGRIPKPPKRMNL